MYSLRRIRKNVATSSTDASSDKKPMMNKGEISIWSSSSESHGKNSINLHDEVTLERELNRTEKKMSHAGVCSSWSVWFHSKHQPHLSTDDGLTKNDPISPSMLTNTQPIIYKSRFEAMASHYSKAIYAGAPVVSSHENTPTLRVEMDDAPETTSSSQFSNKTDSVATSSQLSNKTDSVAKAGNPKKKYYVDTKEASTEEESADDETAAETPSPPSTGRGYLNRFHHGQWV
jgi:hypothetical protein